jgi:hypothetical protein
VANTNYIFFLTGAGDLPLSASLEFFEAIGFLYYSCWSVGVAYVKINYEGRKLPEELCMNEMLFPF